MRTALAPVAIISLCILSSCTEGTTQPEVQQPAAEPPVLVYAQTSLVTPFFTSGASEAPSVDWNGEAGSLTLGSPVSGVSVDPNTGTVTWDPALPLGTSRINVIAANSGGQTSVSLEIENQFQGEFAGDLGPDATGLNVDLTLDYTPDGTVEGTTALEQVFVTGTWELEGTALTTVFGFGGPVAFANVEAAFRTLTTDILHSSTSAELEGPWYYGNEVVTGSEDGVAEFQLTAR